MLSCTSAIAQVSKFDTVPAQKINEAVTYVKDRMYDFNRGVTVTRVKGLRAKLPALKKNFSLKKLGYLTVDIRFWDKNKPLVKPIGGKVAIEHGDNFKPMAMYDIEQLADGYRVLWIEGYISN